MSHESTLKLKKKKKKTVSSVSHQYIYCRQKGDLNSCILRIDLMLWGFPFPVPNLPIAENNLNKSERA